MPPLRATRPTRNRKLWPPRYRPLGSLYIGPFQGGGPFEASRTCGGSSAQAKTDSILTKGAVAAAAANMDMATLASHPFHRHRLAGPDCSGGFKGPRAPRANEGTNSKRSLEGPTTGESPIPPPPSGRPRSFGWLQRSSRSQSRRGKQQQVFPRRAHHRRATHSTACLAGPDRSGGFKGPRAPRADQGNSKCSLEEPTPGEPPIPPPPSGRPRSFWWLQGSSRSQSQRGNQQQAFPRRAHHRRATHPTTTVWPAQIVLVASRVLALPEPTREPTASVPSKGPPPASHPSHHHRLAGPDRSGGFKGPRAPRADQGNNSKCSLEKPTPGEPPIPPPPSGRPRSFWWLQGSSRSQSQRGNQQQAFPRRAHHRRATHPTTTVWPAQIVRVASRVLALPEPTREPTASVPSKGPPPASHPSHHHRLAGPDRSGGFKGPRSQSLPGKNSKCSLEEPTPGEPPSHHHRLAGPDRSGGFKGPRAPEPTREPTASVPSKGHHRRATHPTTTVWPAQILRVASRVLALPEPTRETTASVPSKSPPPASHPSHHHRLAGPDRSGGFKGPRAPRANGNQQQAFPRRAHHRRATHPTTTVRPAQIVLVASRVLALSEPTRETTASVPSKSPPRRATHPPPPSGRPRSFWWLQGSSRSQSQRGNQQQAFPRRAHHRRATHPPPSGRPDRSGGFRVLALPEPTREPTASVPEKGPPPASHPSHHHRLAGPDRSGGFKGPRARADEGNIKFSLEGPTFWRPQITCFI
ncbi:trithorax group protein osa-like [Dermacentor silvarum]|uniref:trithorax group protein osa-like n=1 Tax=Dermacentor silvarum TaxID=543639 RepID=UPI001896B6F8|nr:trithorax group protein osa-like [Dermacentor silvarum]